MAVETRVFPCKYASGHVAVVGLGIGIAPYNLALNRNVESVYIIEPDSHLVELFVRSMSLKQREHSIFGKIRFIGKTVDDILPGELGGINLLVVDKWNDQFIVSAMTESASIYQKIKPDLIYIRGQELDLLRWSQQEYGSRISALEQIICEWKNIQSFPVLSTEIPEYERFIRRILVCTIAQNELLDTTC